MVSIGKLTRSTKKNVSTYRQVRRIARLNKLCKRVIALSLLLLLAFSSTSWAATYQITEEQLMQLEQNLQRLENLNSELSVNSTASAKELVQALYELKSLKEQLKALQTETQTAQERLKKANQSLDNLNQSFRTLEKQNKRLQTETALWKVIAGIVGVYAVVK